MTEKQLTHLSKFLSLVLRHKPDEIGITLDSSGWIDIATLLAAAARHNTPITHDQLLHIVATSDKKRFALSPDGLRIRANQGHSVAVDLALAAAAPPETLYHGTATRFLTSIRQQGLLKMQRQHVHLHHDLATAAAVGTRHGQLAMLQIRSAEMHAAGHLFFLSANTVWLTDAVPPQFITFP